MIAASSADDALEPQRIERLVHAYPEQLMHADAPNVVLWQDGTRMVFDDGVAKDDFEALLNHASIKDQMLLVYPSSWLTEPPVENHDPGRIRNDAFFRKMYGNSEQEVEKHLVSIDWLNGASLRVTRVNGVDRALMLIHDEIQSLPNDILKYVEKPVGSFLWRPIAGTTRLSMHSFGAAVDFQLPGALYRYWLWDATTSGKPPVYPREILDDGNLRTVVEIFERHGFIWGGKWFHYDTMHFEYRPELVGLADTSSE